MENYRRRRQGEKEGEKRKGRDVANKRGKDKESCANMNRERKLVLIVGWYCFPLCIHFFRECFLLFVALINDFSKPSCRCLHCTVVESLYLFALHTCFLWTCFKNSPPFKSCLCGKAEPHGHWYKEFSTETTTLLWTNAP